MEYLITEETSNALHIHLNRARALNSLSCEIIHAIRYLLRPSPKSLIFTGEGRAFCAGGDVVSLANRSVPTSEYFRAQYALFYDISCLPQRKLSILDGITIGAGVGLSMACTHRLTTNRTLWAMPETEIGFIPDVGASYFLNQLPLEGLGLYLALTGNRLNGPDCYLAGISNIYVPELKERDRSAILQQGIDAAIALSQTPDSEKSQLLRNLPMIGQCFREEFDVETIFNRLECIGNQWSSGVLQRLKEMCPISLKVGKENLKRGRGMRYHQALEMELNVVNKVTEDIPYNFVHAVTHKLVEKQKTKPEWRPNNLFEISDSVVQRYYENHNIKLMDFKL